MFLKCNRLRYFPFILLFLVFTNISLAGNRGSHYVRYVVDGDTIVLDDGTTVRYLGMNTPEIAHKDTTAEPYGREAAEYNRYLVEHRRVNIFTDDSEHDRYGRTLAWVYLPGKGLVNEILVRKGFAHVCFYRKDDPVRPRLLKAQQKAIAEKAGIWSLSVKNRESWYIGNKRSLILHRPSCRYGSQTSKKNMVIFHETLEAYKKGYCRCKICKP